MSSLNSLFDNWQGDGEITHSSSAKDTTAKTIKELWKIWCSLTEREDVKKEDADFASAVRSAVVDGITVATLTEIVEGAARTEPRNKDPRDIRRVVTAVTNPKVRKFALAALSEDLPIQTNPNHKQRLTMREVESILETNRDDWGDEDIEAAVTLSERYTEAELISLADKTALIVGQTSLFPSEVTRNLRKIDAGNFKIKKNANRSSYGAGVSESELTERINFYADKAADVAFNRGVPASLVLVFHEQAPKGYWEEVSNLRRSSKLPHDAIYSSLEERFDWHPNRRESIAKGKK